LKESTKARIRKSSLLYGLYKVLLRSIRYASYIKEYWLFRRMLENGPHRLAAPWSDRYPCLNDRTGTTAFDAHYIFHPAWAARILAQTKPAEHIDISSAISFSATVSAFVPTRFFDYRPADLKLSNLTSEHADLFGLPFPDSSIPSLSCMHVVEHVGLGRYGDPFDPDGDLKAINELRRVVAEGGNLLFVVPAGRPRIMFNAHRVYAYEQVVSAFPDFELVQFALVPDSVGGGELIIDASPHLVASQEYGCGCFWFRKVTGDLTHGEVA
jgi:SAM-dependent methyltransferase